MAKHRGNGIAAGVRAPATARFDATSCVAVERHNMLRIGVAEEHLMTLHPENPDCGAPGATP
jgi:hypothetical protein